MILRAVAASAALAASLVLLTGCLAPAPGPTPTPTAAFPSEAEAFAAAEETYRAYVDAVNARRADPRSQPDPQSFLIGEALERDIDSAQEFDELGIRVAGPSTVSALQLASADLDTGTVVLHACYDSTETRVLNLAGDDVTVADRDPTVMIQVSVLQVGEEQLIRGMSPVEGDPC